MSTLYLGYDPGGDGRHGVAAVDTKQAICTTVDTAQKAVEWFFEHSRGHEPTALGIDTLTLWSTGPAGWRPADRALRAAYPSVRNSIAASNSLSGSMPINGVAVALALCKEFPKLQITETHPKVLYFALMGLVYNFHQQRDQMVKKLAEWVAVKTCEVRTDHEWDALLSAYAARQWATRQWQIDLHLLSAVAGETLIPAHGKKAHYAWPNADPLAQEHARAPHVLRQGREFNNPRQSARWKSAVEILRSAGYVEVAKQIDEYRSSKNTKSGWDARLKARHPKCWALVERAND